MDAEPQHIRAGFEAFYRDKWAERDGYWLDWYPRHLALYADLLRQRNRAIAAALPEGLDRVLDEGCGAGDVSRMLAERARQVVSFDIVQANARLARRNLVRSLGRATVLRAGGEELPFPDASFDAAVLADVIEHIPRADRAVAELFRVLRPGALLVVVTPDKDVLEAIERVDRVAMSAVSALRAAARKLLRRAYHPAPAHDGAWEEFFTRARLRELVEAAGFTVREQRNICFYPGPEGGGTFALLLAYLAPFRRLRERLLEPALRALFAAVARLERLNQKQLIVAERP